MGKFPDAVFSRGGTLLPSSYADARYIDAVIVTKGHTTTRILCTKVVQRPQSPPRSMSSRCSTEAPQRVLI